MQKYRYPGCLGFVGGIILPSSMRIIKKTIVRIPSKQPISWRLVNVSHLGSPSSLRWNDGPGLSRHLHPPKKSSVAIKPSSRNVWNQGATGVFTHQRHQIKHIGKKSMFWFQFLGGTSEFLQKTASTMVPPSFIVKKTCRNTAHPLFFWLALGDILCSSEQHNLS